MHRTVSSSMSRHPSCIISKTKNSHDIFINICVTKQKNHAIMYIQKKGQDRVHSHSGCWWNRRRRASGKKKNYGIECKLTNCQPEVMPSVERRWLASQIPLTCMAQAWQKIPQCITINKPIETRKMYDYPGSKVEVRAWRTISSC